MINIFLCDDNEVYLARYQETINSLAKKYNIPVDIKIFTNGESLLFNIEEDITKPDIIYLDIVMDNINGIQLAKKLRKIDCTAEIIFISSSDDYVFESFDVEPLHYIVKGSRNKKEKFEEIFLKAINIAKKKDAERFLCRCKGVNKSIKLREITHFIIEGRKVKVFYENTSFEFYATIEKLLVNLPTNTFVRCHRSVIVNIRYVETFTATTAVLSTGEELMIGGLYINEFKKAFSNNLVGEL